MFIDEIHDEIRYYSNNTWGESLRPSRIGIPLRKAALLPGTISSPGASVHAAHQLAGLGVDA